MPDTLQRDPEVEALPPRAATSPADDAAAGSSGATNGATDGAAAAAPWPHWRRIAFRFLAVYFVLYTAPWALVVNLPFVPYAVVDPWHRMIDAVVQWANRTLFHVRPTLVAPNGSGDTSWSWTQFWLYLSVATIAALVWTLLDRRRPGYHRAAYWLRTLVRYYVAMYAIVYGAIKVVPLQMTFPGLSQLATPLGDLLPMRLSWLFVGYSAPYQMFSGAVELLAGVLLLWRRTVPLGVLVAVAAFTNVLVINLAYDVPVKLFASHLFVMSLFLLALDLPRMYRLFVLNRSVAGTRLWDPPATPFFQRPRVRYARHALKALAVWTLLVVPLWGSYRGISRQLGPQPEAVPLAAGVYDVRLFVRNGDTIPALVNDTVRWQDFIVDNASGGSVASTDTLFRQRYRRGYFRYRADTGARTIFAWRSTVSGDSTPIFTARYELPDTASARLWAKLGADSLYVELVRKPRHFQLTERQFHWLSEYNR